MGNRISPAAVHSPPPLETETLQRSIGVPPEALIFFSWPAAKSPIKRLSGDQNGVAVLSAPVRTCTARESSERTARTDSPDRDENTIAIRSPSGEMAR